MIWLDPNSAIDYCNCGAAYGSKGNNEKAISDFTEAIQLDPTYTLAYYNRGAAYLRTGNPDKADADLATARRLKGNR